MIKIVSIALQLLVIAVCTAQPMSSFHVKTGNKLLANEFRKRAQSIAKTTTRADMLPDFQEISSIFDLAKIKYNDPILVSTADIVGMKYFVAQKTKMHERIGFDLVANCVNNLLAQGAEPFFFLDYLATGKLDIIEGTEIMAGVATACKEAHCSLIGAEAIELPAIYQQGEYDVAGFAVGLVEREQLLPKANDIQPDDVLIGLGSSTIHPHTFASLQKLFTEKEIDITSKPPFASYSPSIAAALLEPATIYVAAVLPLCKAGKIKAIAHTSEGLTPALSRTIPDQLGVSLDFGSWHLPPLFRWIKHVSAFDDKEMARTFNLGIGMILVTSAEVAQEILPVLRKTLNAHIVGKITAYPGEEHVSLEGAIQSPAMRVMVTGNGGREHALAWKLAQSPCVGIVCIAPGNGGTIQDPKFKNIPINLTHTNALLTYAQQNKIDLIVASENLLSNGFADQCAAKGIRCLGSCQASFKIQNASKEFFEQHSIPTIPDPRPAGQEISFAAITDGTNTSALTSAFIYTKHDNADKGAETLGMGAYSPANSVTKDIQARLMKEIVEPIVRGMKVGGNPISGFLEVRVLITPQSQLYVAGFRCNLSDQTAQTILPRLKSDLFTLCNATVDKKLDSITVELDSRSALSVTIVTGNDSQAAHAEDVIVGLPEEDSTGTTKIFHCATAHIHNKLVTNGERVLCAAALGDSLEKARNAVYALVKNIYWPDSHYRSDIGYQAISQKK